MYEYLDDAEDPVPERRDADPIAIASLALVAGTTAYLGLNAWVYWDQFGEGGAVADRLRTVAFVVNPLRPRRGGRHHGARLRPTSASSMNLDQRPARGGWSGSSWP
jgi:hypothetical protein